MANEQEFNLFGGNMLSEEQFHKMMADEDTAMQQEREAQLRLLPRGIMPELPEVRPSPPLVPEPPVQLPTPPARGPFAPPPEGPAPETPFRRLPTPPRPNRLEAGIQNPVPTDEQDHQDIQRSRQLEEQRYQRERLPTPEEQLAPEEPSAPPPAFGNRLAAVDTSGMNPVSAERIRRNKLFDQMRDENEAPSDPYPPDVRSRTKVAQNNQTATDASPFSRAALSQADEERYSPETAKAYLTQGAALDRTNARLAAQNGPQPSEAQKFAGEFLNGAMALIPGGPRGMPFRGSIPRSAGVESPSTPFRRSVQETVGKPAIRIDGETVHTGTDHGDAWINAGEPNVSYSRTNRAPDQHLVEDGFLTSNNRFVSRQEAMELARETGQVPRTEQGGDAWNYRLNSEDLAANRAPGGRGEGAATYTPRDEGKVSPSTRVPREPPPDTPDNGTPGSGGRPPTGRGPMVQGNRVYGEQTGELGPKDAELRSVRRTGKLPPEEADLGSKVSQFPDGYFDRVPRERRMLGAGLSHPGYRWQIMENGSPIGTPQMNKMKANQRADKLSSTYDTRYTVAPRPAGESELTPSERSYLKKYEINIPRNGND